MTINNEKQEEKQAAELLPLEGNERQEGVEEALDAAEPEEEPKKKSSKWKWLGAGALAVIFKFSKVVALLKWAFVFLKLGKFFTTGFSMLVMIAAYAFMFGWWYAVGIVVLLFVHELGHLIASRRLGLETGLPVFIPFVGAFIKMKQEPQDAKTEAIVGIGGPVLGLVGAFLCYGIGLLLQSPLLYAVAYFGFFITVFNMIPAHPLDGGRIVTAVSPYMWLVGIPVIAGLSLWYFNPIAILISLLAIQKAWKTWKDRNNPYYATDAAFRFKMGLAYFLVLGLSAYYSFAVHELLGVR
ncbi:site-2 protease family protein [Azotosporobacter soli]|uniref:site-2 protease family protein n=1 Tax=Azotosporobacter soli TaxID=3055040 RepID=UPI0031FECE61